MPATSDAVPLLGNKMSTALLYGGRAESNPLEKFILILPIHKHSLSLSFRSREQYSGFLREKCPPVQLWFYFWFLSSMFPIISSVSYIYVHVNHDFWFIANPHSLHSMKSTDKSLRGCVNDFGRNGCSYLQMKVVIAQWNQENFPAIREEIFLLATADNKTDWTIFEWQVSEQNCQ